MDRASYEAGFRAAQEQNLQQPPEQGNQFLDAVGKTALGLGVAVGAGLAGRRLMRGRGNVRPTDRPQKNVVDVESTPVGSRRDRVEQNAEQVSKYGMVRDPQKSGVNVRDLSKIDPDAVRRAAAYGKTPEVQYEAPGRIEPQDFSSPEVREARRQQATQDLLAAQKARTGTFQPEIPGIKGDLMAIRSKEGFDPQVTGETTPSAPSRPLSAAPDQLSIDFSKKYLSDKGYVDTSGDVGSRLKAKGLGMAGMPGEGPLEIDIDGRRAAIDSPTGEALLKSAGVTAAEAESYWSNKLRSQGLLEETSVEVQKSNQPLVSNQSVEALDTAADQEAMRVSRTVQRDPGENLAEFQVTKDRLEQRGASPVEAADTAVAITEGNEAFTQTDRPLNESSAARFLANERDEIASQLAEQGSLVTPGRIEKELGNRLGSKAYEYGPEYTQLKQNIQLGATYDPELFDNPSKPFVRIAGEEVPTGRVAATKLERTPYTNELIAEDVELGLRQPTYMKETAERLQERAADQRDWLGSVRLEEASKNAKLNAELINTNRQYNRAVDFQTELNDFLDSGKGTPKQRESARILLDDTGYELDRLDVRSEQLNQRVYGGQSGARVRGAEKFTEDYIASLTPPSRLKPGIEEGQRLFFEVDELSGEPIPGTQELRSERKMVDMKAKGGGGRNVAEFTAGSRDEGVEIDLGSILQEARTPIGQSAREYTKDQFGYRPGTGLTGEALEGKPFTDDRTQTGRVITRTGIQKSGPQPGSMKAAVNPYTQLDDETLGMISLQGSEADASNAARILARRRREGYDTSTLTGPGQSQRVVSSVALTPEQKQTKIKSIDVSQQIAALQRSGRPDAQQQVQKYLQELRGGI